MMRWGTSVSTYRAGVIGEYVGVARTSSGTSTMGLMPVPPSL